ncbi:AAA domain-containing protein [Acetobacterium wieringae]|uniref:AAA domain-containing protein n=1 Tax=Acetobacterium wieringae TaxID=52694 RepID=UPI0026EEC51A|nr:AAA domain-containing protein [Acetobacterium wieringae]
MDKIQNLLSYWHSIEFFSPAAYPNDSKCLITQSTQLLPWQESNPNSQNQASKLPSGYTIYLGRIEVQSLINAMNIATKNKDESIENDKTPTYVCTIRVNDEGFFTPSTFCLLPFVWSVSKIVKSSNIRSRLNEEELEALNKKINAYLEGSKRPLDFKDLNDFFTKLMKDLGLKIENDTFQIIVKEINNTKKNNGDDENKEVATSFYASDIRMISAQVKKSDPLLNYILGLKVNKPRVSIDKDVPEMKKWLNPDKYPLGKWPSKHSPSLMQQLAINIAVSDHESPMFSVNGPPGTGKTTLLKEVIASNIVQRACLLSKYEHPNDAFHRVNFESPDNHYCKCFFRMDDKIKPYGIVVASSNNAAVENISKELPLLDSVCESHTNLFNPSDESDLYFSQIANTLSGPSQKSWGLVSARLGKKTNINAFKNAFWFQKNRLSITSMFETNVPDWKSATAQFNKKLNEVISYRKYLNELQQHLDRCNEMTQLCQQKLGSNATLKDYLVQCSAQIEKRDSYLRNVLAQLNESVTECNNLQSKIKEMELISKNQNISFLKRIISKKYAKAKAAEQLMYTAEITSIRKEYVELTNQVDYLTAEFSSNSDTLNKLEADKATIEAIITQNKHIEDQIRKEFGTTFTGSDFWKDIQKNEKSQLISPWTNEHYDKLREELFFYALMLQKAFVLNSSCVRQNLTCLNNTWSNELSEKNKSLSYSELLNTLLVIVPVLSTTFASISSFMRHVNKNELGTLIIDEAGQATPYSALGALWRTRKAIIVGDPMQIEPVVTIPRELKTRFADEYNIDAEYRSSELSVQQLADNINQYGGSREFLNDTIWVGCPLVVHRRCLDPMFSISNQIAYNNRMFRRTSEPNGVILSLKKSHWLDVKGAENGNKDHFVYEQGSVVLKLIVKAFEDQGEDPSLYIITPFTSVRRQMTKMLQEELPKYLPGIDRKIFKRWIEKSCGTIHTFQGKETNEVIILLGCDEDKGAGAAHWAGKRPNILNVALTRAKYHVIIVGDSCLWKKIPNFRQAYYLLSQ